MVFVKDDPHQAFAKLLIILNTMYMKPLIPFLFFLFVGSVLLRAQSVEQDGLVTSSSAYAVDETVERLKTAMQDAGLKVIAEVNHAQAASKNDLQLKPTYLILFGNPQVGTRLMQVDARAGLDLPLRMLVWESEQGQVFVTYQNPMELLKNYQLAEEKETLQKMQGMLKKLTQKISTASR